MSQDLQFEKATYQCKFNHKTTETFWFTFSGATLKLEKEASPTSHNIVNIEYMARRLFLYESELLVGIFSHP